MMLRNTSTQNNFQHNELKKSLKSLETIINSCCSSSIRNDVFRHGMPTTYTRKFNYGLEYYDLKIATHHLFAFNNKLVKKMRLLRSTHGQSACICFTYQDNSKETRSIEPVKLETVENAIREFSQKNEVFSYRFANPGLNQISWKTISMSTVYYHNKPSWKVKLFNPEAEGPEKHYQMLHTRIIQNIISFMKQYPDLNLNIIDGGCGEGDLLNTLEKELHTQGIKNNFKLFGFDYNAKNIRSCKTFKNKCNYSVGNLLQLDQVIADAEQQGFLNREYKSILILSGSLTNLVLHNAFEAVQILQIAKRLAINYLIGGGFAHPFVNSFILKRIGYGTYHKGVISQDKHSFFDCYLLRDEQILQNKINKIKNKNMLDLTMSAEPEKWLKQLNEQKLIQDDLTIDLSYCQPTPALLAMLQEIHKQFSQINWIYWHWDSLSINSIIDFFGPLAKLEIKRTEQDSYLLSGRSFFKAVIDQPIKMDNAEVKKILLDDFDVEYLVNTENYLKMEAVAKNPEFTSQTKNMLEYAYNKKAFDIMLFIMNANFATGLSAVINLISQNLVINRDMDSILHVAIRDSKTFKNTDDKNKFLEEICPIIGYHRRFYKYNDLQQSLITLAKKSYDADALLHFRKMNAKMKSEISSALSTHFLENAPLDFKVKIYANLYPKMLSKLDKEGKTALHCAYKSQQLKTAEYLLQTSWKLFFAKDKSGKYALEYADEKSLPDACKQAENALIRLINKLKKSDLKNLSTNIKEMRIKFNKNMITSPQLFNPTVCLTVTYVLNMLDAVSAATLKQIENHFENKSTIFKCF